MNCIYGKAVNVLFAGMYEMNSIIGTMANALFAVRRIVIWDNTIGVLTNRKTPREFARNAARYANINGLILKIAGKNVLRAI